MRNVQGRLQYDPQRGVMYFFNDKTGECLLRVEGARDVPEGHQLDIHLVEPGNEHHHEHCGNRELVLPGAGRDLGSVCAVKLVRQAPIQK